MSASHGERDRHGDRQVDRERHPERDHAAERESRLEPDRRIYFVGAHGTGKTTLARYVRDRYGLKLISEVARSILAELEISLDRLRSNVEAVNRYQLEVFRRQIYAERESGDAFVSDRAFCNLAYTANHGTIMHEIFRDPALEEYMRWVSGGLVFFVRPHMELVVADGVRSGLKWEDVVIIDGMVKLLLEMYAIPYITVASLMMQERVRLVDEVIRLRHPLLAARARGRQLVRQGEREPGQQSPQGQPGQPPERSRAATPSQGSPRHFQAASVAADALSGEATPTNGQQSADTTGGSLAGDRPGGRRRPAGAATGGGA